MAEDFYQRIETLPLVAILRGVQPENVCDVGRVLTDSGFVVIEVPLNSPQPFDSIAALATAFGERVFVGAGTVLRIEDVSRVAEAGGRIIVMPHGDVSIIAEAKRLGLICLPGVATPSEGFAAMAAGADAIKLFPAEALPPAVVKAWRAVFPAHVRFFPVGGITPENMADYWAAGANGFGLGSALFKPGLSLAEVENNAQSFVAAFGRIKGERLNNPSP